ncbi:hypothetical protein [Micromonospora sp. NPDC005203]
MPTPDGYFLALHEPYSAPTHPVPINATIVHSRRIAPILQFLSPI